METHTFYKYQGAGNDFIIFDNRNELFDRANVDLVRKLCDRRFGIGADGLMLLQDVEGHDFEMIYYNADGHEGSMCGNGGRCIVAFAQDLGITGSQTDFLAADGVHHARIHANNVGWISLQMIDVDAVQQDGEAYILNTGSPHYIKIVQHLDTFAVFEEGRKVRYNDTYRDEGINVNFVQAENGGYYVRTYERGVEDETLACGTGATAVALAMAWRQGEDGEFETPIRVAGGKLTIRFSKAGDHFTNVFLEGPAEFVFKGEISW
ncbi:diaminopimelate epimerase [Parapedobacter luteus]|uniref:Diaminopimelate epimerase n=1 Tax=Parapedobacter luteus TaxID=623280 RepID=A0A1T5BPU2_9SPHI|nr:diaminopimelate epimerase [Parapedobacter luteus]SKB49145.1 diaminopimelate epimerase [Parapedobacter luteus]